MKLFFVLLALLFSKAALADSLENLKCKGTILGDEDRAPISVLFKINENGVMDAHTSVAEAVTVKNYITSDSIVENQRVISRIKYKNGKERVLFRLILKKPLKKSTKATLEVTNHYGARLYSKNLVCKQKKLSN